MPQLCELVRRVIVVSQALIERSPEHTGRVLNRLYQMEREIKQNFPGHPSLAQIGAVIETLSAAHAQNTSRPDLTRRQNEAFRNRLSGQTPSARRRRSAPASLELVRRFRPGGRLTEGGSRSRGTPSSPASLHANAQRSIAIGAEIDGVLFLQANLLLVQANHPASAKSSPGS